jgi:hypothetical protein
MREIPRLRGGRADLPSRGRALAALASRDAPPTPLVMTNLPKRLQCVTNWLSGGPSFRTRSTPSCATKGDPPWRALPSTFVSPRRVRRKVICLCPTRSPSAALIASGSDGRSLRFSPSLVRQPSTRIDQFFRK